VPEEDPREQARSPEAAAAGYRKLRRTMVASAFWCWVIAGVIVAREPTLLFVIIAAALGAGCTLTSYLALRSVRRRATSGGSPPQAPSGHHDIGL